LKKIIENFFLIQICLYKKQTYFQFCLLLYKQIWKYFFKSWLSSITCSNVVQTKY